MDEKSPSELTAAESEAVRRLLADARADEPMPDDVAARLDDVLAGLVAERPTDTPLPEPALGEIPEPGAAPADEGAVVVPLRRRRWPQVVLAAAAVTVFGYGGLQLVSGGSGSEDADRDAGSASSLEATDQLGEGEDSGPLQGDPETGQETGRDPAAELAPTATADGVDGFGYSLADKDLDRVAATYDLGQLVDLGRLSSEDGVALRQSLQANLTLESEGTLRGLGRAEASSAGRGVSCGPHYEVEGSRSYAARWKGRLALVLAFPPVDGLRRIEIYDCGSAEPRRTVQVVTLVDGE